MSGPINIQSAGQWQDILNTTNVVIADCELLHLNTLRILSISPSPPPPRANMWPRLGQTSP